MRFREKLGKEMLLFDGAMGTQLQAKGLKAGELPEIWNLTHKETVRDIHRAYVHAGCDILKANTFGANALKFEGTPYTVSEIVQAAVENARTAAAESAREVYVALDLGPTGKLLKPYGELEFSKAYELYKEQIVAARENVDFILIETMGDLYEIKAAVLAAKENTDLPIAVTMIFDEQGKLLTGADIETALFTLEGLGVDMIGFNCGLGPVQMLPFVRKIGAISSTPIAVNPNAGLPECIDGVTSYNVSPAEFSAALSEIAGCDGVWAVGGCCGTTPAHLEAAVHACKGVTPKAIKEKDFTAVTSYGKTVYMGEHPILIGERINPTGKKRLKAALVEGDEGYIFSEAVAQADGGAHVLDVNVGLPEIDEPTVLERTVQGLQGITDLPLQIDTSDPVAMERALRIYNGKPLINSVNGKQESMDAVFPLAKKYGGVVVCLTLDEHGIPDSAEGRIQIAEKIIKTAESYGISKKNLIIDTLAMTVSTGADNAKITLEALRYIRRTLGVHTVLGVSNISFGLPKRDSINAAFFTLAMENGLSAGIINPKSDVMMNAYYAFCALKGLDENFEQYIGHVTDSAAPANPGMGTDLKTAVIKGLKAEAGEQAKTLLKDVLPLDIINTHLIPALDTVGQGFEKGTIFLPQLLMSADAAKAAFDEIKQVIAQSGAPANDEKKNKIVIATVKGDIHDIGKNIVKVLLENYGFDVIDLGKDVPPEVILETAKRENVRLVGLSALMTTTVANMEITIDLFRREYPDCKIMVGGAVLTQDYANRIGADFYSKDAMGSVRYAEKLFSK